MAQVSWIGVGPKGGCDPYSTNPASPANCINSFAANDGGNYSYRSSYQPLSREGRMELARYFKRPSMKAVMNDKMAKKDDKKLPDCAVGVI
jgi:hypothetical protein